MKAESSWPSIEMPKIEVPKIEAQPQPEAGAVFTGLVLSTWSCWFIAIASILGIAWGMVQAYRIKNIDVDSFNVEHDKEDEEFKDMTEDEANQKCRDDLKSINKMIADGADTFIYKEYTFLAIFCGIFAIVLYLAVDMPW